MEEYNKVVGDNKEEIKDLLAYKQNLKVDIAEMRIMQANMKSRFKLRCIYYFL